MNIGFSQGVKGVTYPEVANLEVLALQFDIVFNDTTRLLLHRMVHYCRCFGCNDQSDREKRYTTKSHDKLGTETFVAAKRLC